MERKIGDHVDGVDNRIHVLILRVMSNAIHIPTVSNNQAVAQGLAGKTRLDKPTYGELFLSTELESAREENRLLRAALQTAQERVALLEEIGGFGLVGVAGEAAE